MPTSPPPPLNALDPQASLYPSGIGKGNEFVFCPGVCVLPLSEDPPTDETELLTYSPVIIARLHAPFRIRKVAYDSKKENNPPAGIPAPEDAGAFVFLGGSLGVVTRLNTTLCNYDWEVATAYTFVENCVSRTRDGFVLGSYQAPNQSSVENATAVGISLSAPPNPPQVPGAIGSAGNDAVTGYMMATNPTGGPFNVFGTWGYNQDAYLPGLFFNAVLINASLYTQPVTATLSTG